MCSINFINAKLLSGVDTEEGQQLFEVIAVLRGCPLMCYHITMQEHAGGVMQALG